MLFPGKVQLSPYPPLLTGGYDLHLEGKKLGKLTFDTSVSVFTSNIALIDWLTVTCHGVTLDQVLDLLGMNHCPWDDTDRYMNGYPARLYFSGINILYGADDPKLVPDPTKIRHDMGICINMSGTGCRAFETYSTNDWISIFREFFTLTDVVKEKNGRKYSYNITRLDLAYDDHTGVFDINNIASSVKDRYYISPSKYSEIKYSDNQEDDIQGLTVYIGSAASDIRFRFYDKAAERGYTDRHWIRLEMQLRNDRATVAASHILSQSIGDVLKGICHHYLSFVDPCQDSNKSRWPVTYWWSSFLDSVSDIRLFENPGIEYNIAKSEYYLLRQYGPLMLTFDSIYDSQYIIDKVKSIFSVDDLDPKYRRIIDQFKLDQEGLDNENDDS